MKKRILIVVLTVIIACSSLVALVACNKNAPASVDFEVPEGGYDGSSVEITFYHAMGTALQKQLEKAITRFNEIYPNITVTHSSKGNYDSVQTQINTALAGGVKNAPSMSFCYSDHVAVYNMAKAVIKLDSLVDSTVINSADNSLVGYTQEQKDDFYGNFYDEGKVFDVEKSLYQLPMMRSTDILYYNKTFFEKKNYQVPTHWWCTEDCDADCKSSVEYICEQIKKDDNSAVPFGYDSEANWFITLCEQMESGYTTYEGDTNFIFDNETNKTFVKKLREWRQKGYITTKSLENGKYVSDLFKVGEVENTQKCYMCVGSSGGASYQIPSEGLFEVGVAVSPSVDPENPKYISQGPSICIFNKENKQEVMAAWLFAKFLTTDVEFQADYAMQNGYIPVIKSAKEDAIFQQWLAKADGADYLAASAAKVCYSCQENLFTSLAFNGSSTARTQVGLLLAKCISANTSDVDGLINESFNDAIDKCIYDQQ